MAFFLIFQGKSCKIDLKKNITHSEEIIEGEILINNVTIRIFLVFYDYEKDF